MKSFSDPPSTSTRRVSSRIRALSQPIAHCAPMNAPMLVPPTRSIGMTGLFQRLDDADVCQAPRAASAENQAKRAARRACAPAARSRAVAWDRDDDGRSPEYGPAIRRPVRLLMRTVIDEHELAACAGHRISRAEELEQPGGQLFAARRRRRRAARHRPAARRFASTPRAGDRPRRAESPAGPPARATSPRDRTLLARRWVFDIDAALALDEFGVDGQQPVGCS